MWDWMIKNIRMPETFCIAVFLMVDEWVHFLWDTFDLWRLL